MASVNLEHTTPRHGLEGDVTQRHVFLSLPSRCSGPLLCLPSPCSTSYMSSGHRLTAMPCGFPPVPFPTAIPIVTVQGGIGKTPLSRGMYFVASRKVHDAELLKVCSLCHDFLLCRRVDLDESRDKAAVDGLEARLQVPGLYCVIYIPGHGGRKFSLGRHDKCPRRLPHGPAFLKVPYSSERAACHTGT